jgi:GNAT superfamily N-acetyltransferase
MIENGEFDIPQGKMPVVVTYLEMRTPPATSEMTAPEGLSLRQVEPTLEWYRDVFSRVGSRDWLWYGRLKMDDDTLRTILDDPAVVLFTLEKDGRDEALLELDFRIEGACELAYFGLPPNLIGTGAGRFLMNEAIVQAWDRKIERFHVHTCTNDSRQALGFYIRSGFTPYKRTLDIDDDPRLTGVLPRDYSPAIPIL